MKKRVSSKMICFQLNSRVLPWCRTRRGEIKRPLSESGVDDVQHKPGRKPSPRASQKLFWVAANPKGGHQAPSIRIRGRHIFHVFSTSYEKTLFLLQRYVFFQLNSRFLPWCRTRRGVKKRPLSESAFDTCFMFSRHLMKNVFLLKRYVFNRIRDFYLGAETEGG